eukprot:g308.t1
MQDSQVLMVAVKDLQKRYIQRAKRKVREQGAKAGGGASGLDDKDALNDIRGKRRLLVDKADEKVAIAVQTYDLVDNHIRRLDSDLKSFVGPGER